MPGAVRYVGALLDRAVSLAVSTTRTGNSPRPSLVPCSSSPRWYCRRQVNTWFALTPCARATRATDAPGCSVSSTIRRFSSTERRRRRSTLLTTALYEVSTYPPSGHNRKCPLGPSWSPKTYVSRRPNSDAYPYPTQLRIFSRRVLVVAECFNSS